MDCQEIKELLDAYALGAAEQAEAQVLEEHVADCVRCWEELNEAQRAAALLFLSVASEQAPALLGERILAQAQREAHRQRPAGGLWPLLAGLTQRWRVAAGGLALVGVAGALAFAVVLQVQMNDLRDENRALGQQVQEARALTERQRQILAVLSAPDTARLEVPAVAPGSTASAMYHWSRSAKMGLLSWSGLAPLSEGWVYQVWFILPGKDGRAVSTGAFEGAEGSGQLPMDLSFLDEAPHGIGISVEEAGGSSEPTSDWLMYADISGR